MSIAMEYIKSANRVALASVKVHNSDVTKYGEASQILRNETERFEEARRALIHEKALSIEISKGTK